MTRHNYIPKKGDRFTPIVKEYQMECKEGGICQCTHVHRINTTAAVIYAKDMDYTKFDDRPKDKFKWNRKFPVSDFEFRKERK